MPDGRTSVGAEAADTASYRALIRRLPVTLRPSLNGQLAEWETLFPFERQRVQEFMRGVASFDPSAFNALLEPLRKLEAKMDVAHWDFNETADTMENASLLARSAYFAEWREQIRRIYSAVEAAANASTQPPAAHPRLIVAILPESLPYDRAALWKKWGSRGVELSIDGDPARLGELLLQGFPGVPGLLAQQGRRDVSDLWLIDAGSRLQAISSAPAAALCLSCAELSALRERVLAEVNTVPKSIEITDQTLAGIRSRNWDPWWPAELKGQPSLRRFVIDLYLSGNGALIFSNAFVEWAASEAIRRARPRVLFARFGLRAKPKPFTGIAIFENQQRISTLPDVDDPLGSAVDASVLARYIFLAAQRYPQAAQTAFLCVAESIKSAYVILPEASSAGWTAQRAVAPDQIAGRLIEFLSAQSNGDG
ncbi:MAG: hypothetical protein ACLQG3_17080 [Terracidiphilus sp.]